MIDIALKTLNTVQINLWRRVAVRKGMEWKDKEERARDVVSV